MQVFIYFHIFYEVTKIYSVKSRCSWSKGVLRNAQNRKGTFECILLYRKGGHLGNEAVAPCEKEESWDFSKVFIRLSNNTEPPSWKETTLN